MSKKLVIVESPAKAKTINKILGPGYMVKASMGHVRDLPIKTIGVDVKNSFEPSYIVAPTRKAVVTELKKAAAECDGVYLAPDPDREGEAIAWHLQEVLKVKKDPKPFWRVQFNEITAPAVRKAFEHPSELDMNRVDAQQARRILDRLVGYTVSPMLWRRLKRGLSAGRVQSVALRLVCEREAAIRAFVPEPYWILGAKVRKQVAPKDPFTIRLTQIDGKKQELKVQDEVDNIRKDLASRTLTVTDVQFQTLSKRSGPPFITSSLQQAASSAFGMTPKRTMAAAQKLYEGVEIGDTLVGLITYMRTDSFNVSQEARDATRNLIVNQFGAEYYPEKPNFYKSRSGAQEAHEAIRPTDVNRHPSSLETVLGPQELKLYRLIWNRFVASQMAPAQLKRRNVKIAALPEGAGAHSYLFHASATDVVFPGYMKVTGVHIPEPEKADSDDEDEEQPLPPLETGEKLDCDEWLADRKETKPPRRYSEASLIRALEENGVGRPSTYAQTISTLQDRLYVAADKRSMVPTPLGDRVNTILVGCLTELFDVQFTATMEEALDKVEEGTVKWRDMLGDFYKKFSGWMADIKEPLGNPTICAALLKAMDSIKDWAPPTKQGKRTYSDQKYVESIKKQLAEEKGKVTVRQAEALIRLAVRYLEQAPGITAALAGTEYEKIFEEAKAGPPPETVRRLQALAGIELDPSARKFVDSLQQRVDGGRSLTEAQNGVLVNILVTHAASIPGFDDRKAEWGLENFVRKDDNESGPLLEALKSVTTWREPVKRGKRVFDDKLFFESLTRQFGVKRALSDKQRGAMKRMIKKYREQIPGYEKFMDAPAAPAAEETEEA